MCLLLTSFLRIYFVTLDILFVVSFRQFLLSITISLIIIIMNPEITSFKKKTHISLGSKKFKLEKDSTPKNSSLILKTIANIPQGL